MFCRNKKNKNNKKENEVSQSSIKKSKFANDYIEIKQLASAFSDLSRFAHDINDIGKEERKPNATMFFYQKSIRQEFIREFERRFEELFCKKMSFDDYWKSRSC